MNALKRFAHAGGIDHAAIAQSGFVDMALNSTFNIKTTFAMTDENDTSTQGSILLGAG
jgi:hypothetical protein